MPALFSAFRPDGWPLCPRCGEDELYSLEMPATVDTITSCYRCGWQPIRERVDDEVAQMWVDLMCNGWREPVAGKA